jgi:hypothetical protein
VPGLGQNWKGLQSAKQSAAIFSGIPVLRGDFGGGCGRVRQIFTLNRDPPLPQGLAPQLIIQSASMCCELV